jgi:uncharacterized damage-inducible protein DinB
MRWSALLAMLTLVVAPVSAHAADVAGIRGEYLASIADAEDKLVRLAESTPAKKFAWRPSKGVRSTSEVFMHVAGANYVLPSFAGHKPPEGITPEMEKTVSDKAKVVATLKESFAHLRASIEKTADGDLDRKVKTWMGEVSVRQLYLMAVTHGHEHLGQSIAYARMSGVTPPWTAAEEEAKEASHQDAGGRSR